MDNLTEFNTAHNRRISMLGISDDNEKRNTNRKRKRHYVSFNEDEEIINPEDIDPSIGRFRNLVQTTIVPTTSKRAKVAESIGIQNNEFRMPKNMHSHHAAPDLYNDLPPESHSSNSSSNMSIYSSLSSRLGMVLPNPAPDVDMGQNFPNPTPFIPPQVQASDSMEPKKRNMRKKHGRGKNRYKLYWFKTL
ncbi:hypothetical protein NQ314_012202 [Rhamnusium bicolor]|uniref:Uncharacterized protein n=1 Tax=Rhamnusium bicolor TaxID=1586634 RepID=A0AAV8XCB3_9CUCU|nr:hypothetical protein NQ314_012202 [Rhamnusium bicolor]